MLDPNSFCFKRMWICTFATFTLNWGPHLYQCVSWNPNFFLVKLPFSSLGTSRAMPRPQLPGACDLTLGSLQSERWPSEFQQGHRVLDAASVPCKVVGGLGNVKPLQFLIYLSCINKYNIYIYILLYLNMPNSAKCIIDLQYISKYFDIICNLRFEPYV